MLRYLLTILILLASPIHLKNNMYETNELIEILSKYEIDKLLIEEASLEDVFLHYYK